MDVKLSGEAKNRYKKLNEPDLSRVAKAIDGLGKEPPKGDILHLGGRKKQWRLRIGDYRILFTIRNNIILITHIESRGQAYSKKTRRKK